MIKQLVDDFEKSIQALQNESLEILDFDKLKKDLSEAQGILKNLGEKEDFCQKVIGDCKKEIKRMCRSLLCLKNEKEKIGLVEKILENGQIGYEELLNLKDEVKKEFDESFSQRGIFTKKGIILGKEVVTDWKEFKI